MYELVVALASGFAAVVCGTTIMYMHNGEYTRVTGDVPDATDRNIAAAGTGIAAGLALWSVGRLAGLL